MINWGELMLKNDCAADNLIDHLSVGLVLTDQAGNIIFTNEVIRKMTGYTEDEIKTVADWYKKAYPNKQEREKAKNNFQHDLENNITDRTYKVMTADGTYKYFNFRYSELEAGKTLFEIIDITGKMESKQKLKSKKLIFENLFTNSLEGIVLLDHNLKIIEINKKFEEIFEVTEEQVVSKYVFDVVSINADSKDIEKVKKEVLNYQGWKNELSFKVNNKTKICKIHIFSVASNDHGNLIYAVVDDITASKAKELELKEVKERLELAVNGAKIGVWDWNVQTNTLHYNQNWAQMLGYKVSELGNTLNTWLQLNHPEDKEKALADIKHNLKGYTEKYFKEHRLKTKSGRWKWIRAIGKVIERDNKGNAYRVVGVHIDIDKQKRAAKEIEYLSIHDELTGLYNRRYFNNELNRLHNSRKYPISIIVGDMNKLKAVNDNYGHSMGDYYIKKAAEILKRNLRSEDVIARIGGDEFAVILPEADQKKVRAVIKRIYKNIELENKKDEFPEPLSIALGAETVESAEKDLEKCFNKADKNMYKHKFNNREETTLLNTYY